MEFYVPNVDQITSLFSDYKNIQYLDKGGFKVVYRGEKSGVKEALKLAYVPNPQNGSNTEREEIIEEISKRVSREIKFLGKCSSPYVVKLGTMEPRRTEIGNNNYIAYTEEFIEGKRLDRVITDGHRPPETELRSLGKCLLSAVREFWINLRIVHRDIKPLNVMKTKLTDRPFILLDLGIAYALRESSITRDPSSVPGTLYYLAPEMLQSNFRETLDYRSDIYTSALTIYEYATGIQPFARKGNEVGQTLYRILKDRPKSLKELRPDLSISLTNVVDQSLKKMPALRPGNIEQLISSLEGGL